MSSLKFLSLCCIAVLCFACGADESITNDQPNIVWIVSEDNSPFIGAYGDTFATTPNIDQLAKEGILYESAFATAPVCAPTRSSLITGMYPTTIGTQHMRSTHSIPTDFHFYPYFLKKAGYYTSNNSKKDYNTIDQPDVWDESSNKAHYNNRPNKDQPFFAIFNFTTSHESSVHRQKDSLRHDPKKVAIPPYHPRTPEMETDWALYYDRVEEMDAKVGEVLRELEENGLTDNTIVFYYSDHGGVLGRSKRFLFESGLRVPLIIRIPAKYQHLVQEKPGSKTDRIVSFIDFPPTLLSLANIDIPENMQGSPFMGNEVGPERTYAYSMRGRMDECIDMSRSIRNKKYRYSRNYMPHKIYGQYLEYLWRAPSMQSWEAAYKAGKLNEVQSRFWETKPVEELYDIEKDPHNINNLALDPQYQSVIEEMRTVLDDWMIETKDVGLLPEPMLEAIDRSGNIYDYVRQPGNYSIEDILPVVNTLIHGDLTNLDQHLSSEDRVIRYWATQACIMYQEKAMSFKEALKRATLDEEISVRIGAAEALYYLGEKDHAIQILTEALDSDLEKARLQALNAFHIMDQIPYAAMESVKTLIPEDETNRNYDVRSARGLVLKHP